MAHRSRAALAAAFLVLALPLHATPADRGLVESPKGSNVALLVGVSHGLPGIDIDVNKLEAISTHPAYNFKPTILEEGKATVSAIAKQLTQLSQDAKEDGTLFFYFSGHGNVGIIYPQDRTMKIQEIRAAIEAGRKNAGPLARLVMVYDSCHAGSLLDPVKRVLPLFRSLDDRAETELFADAIVREFTMDRGEAPYWKKLFVLASSRADETSLASAEGSVFTLAMDKAFKEIVSANGTIGEFIKKSQDYTEGHHPVARLVPESLATEKMAP